jgi:YYY domain-containing protein
VVESPVSGDTFEARGRAFPFVPLALLGILLLAAAFRLTNIHWDEGLALHPDERFLTMVETSIEFPEPCRAFIPHLKGRASTPGDLSACLSAYLDSAQSPLNPRNRGHPLWVYGTLPILILRWVTEAWGITDFTRVTEAGRVLSALADLGTVALTFFLARRLYGIRVGLLASLLLALSVLNIQNAHFFTVDTFTTLSTVLCVWFSVRVAEADRRAVLFLLPLGAAYGAAVACKVNSALFVLIILLAAGIHIWRRMEREGEQAFWPEVRRTVIGLLAAGLIAFAVFRFAQPDAFTGPGILDIRPDPRYLDNLRTVRGLISGEIDYPPSHQWTNRSPLWFPWKNMVLWGMGFPLGLAAWAGMVLAGWQLFRKRDLRPAVPWAWVAFFFIYQGVQFVKTMRYFLPLYPLLCLFAGYLLVWLWDRARAQEPRAGRRTALAGALLGFVTLGTFLWACAFIQIYLRPVTRATASRWIYAHLPTDQGAFLILSDGSRVPVAIPNAQVYSPSSPGSTTPFTLESDAVVTGVRLAHLEDVLHQPGAEVLAVSISADPEGGQVLAQGTIVGDFRDPDPQLGESPGDYTRVAGDAAPGTASWAPLPLEAGRTYYLQLQGRVGVVRAWSTAIANEEWDDPIPMGVDGKNGFAIYRGILLTPYAEDTPEKVERLLHQLANVDYVCLTSNRLYASIPRLPMRYPATTRYYRALFDGSLGYERVATFTSYPTLFGWGGRFGIPIPDDAAEEVFSVYDHPKVILFRRTEAFDIDRARMLLTAGVDWENVARILPRQVPHYRDLLLTDAEWEAQLQGGTWSALFNRNGWANRAPVLVWLFLVEALGLVAFPLAHVLLGRLADGGYLPAKALGVLLLGYGSWLLAATKVLPYSRGTIALVLLLLLLLGGGVACRRFGRLKALVRARYRLLLVEEALFLGGFFLFLLIRLGNPDLWHPWFGGEKPMDLAYLTAIVRSTTFPPYDPWFSGGYLNYYYFGHVLVATLIKLTGIVPSVAYNLALPLLYGLTWGGAFSVVYHLVARRENDAWDPRALRAALAGVAFVALLGNLGEYMLILKKLGELSGLDFRSNIPGLASLVRALAGLPKALREGLPVGIGSWYWDASRVMPRGEINEFPFFTFLYADLHAHLIALPYTLLALTQIVALIREREAEDGSFASLLPSPWALFGLALVLGALRCANSWDFPTYFLLAVLAWAIALQARRKRLDGAWLAGIGLTGLLLWLLSSFLFRPFWERYGAYYTSLTPWTGERSRVGEFVIIHGLFLFVLVSYLLAETFGRKAREAPLRLARMLVRFGYRIPDLVRRTRRHCKGSTAAWRVLGGSVLGLLAVELYLQFPVRSPSGSSLFPLRLRGQPLVGWLVLLALMGLILLLRRERSSEDRLLALLVLAGLGIGGAVELWVLQGDIGRMNTVFKFYLQIWVLWAVASAAALPRLWEAMERWHPRVRVAWRGTLWLLVGLCALYPLLATQAKVRDRFPPVAPLTAGSGCQYLDGNASPGMRPGPGLDGDAFMEYAVYCDEGRPIVLAEDAGAIRWLQENVAGSPVVLEGNSYLYRWGSRISIHTGLPTVIGWDWHQKQQRAVLASAVVDRRLADVRTLYGDPDIERTLELLRRYRISYIVLGQLERLYYPPEGLGKFERMEGRYLERVYPSEAQAGGTVIYRVLPVVWGTGE